MPISGDDQLQEHRDFLERLQPNRDGENLSRLALYFQNFLKKVGSLDDLNNYFVQPEEDLRWQCAGKGLKYFSLGKEDICETKYW